jgi:hypothetical protein
VFLDLDSWSGSRPFNGRISAFEISQSLKDVVKRKNRDWNLARVLDYTWQIRRVVLTGLFHFLGQNLIDERLVRQTFLFSRLA